MDALRLDTICAFLHWLYVGWLCNGRPLTRHYLCVPTLVIRWLARQQTPSDSTLSVRFLHRLYVSWFDNERPPTRHFRAFPTLVIRRLVRQQTPSDSTLSVRSYTGYTSAGSTMDALRLGTSVRFLHRLYVGWFDNGRPPTRHYLCAPTKATRLIHSIALIKKDLVRGPTHRSRRSEGPQPRTTDGARRVQFIDPLRVGLTPIRAHLHLV